MADLKNFSLDTLTQRIGTALDDGIARLRRAAETASAEIQEAARAFSMPERASDLVERATLAYVKDIVIKADDRSQTPGFVRCRTEFAVDAGYIVRPDGSGTNMISIISGEGGFGDQYSHRIAEGRYRVVALLLPIADDANPEKAKV